MAQVQQPDDQALVRLIRDLRHELDAPGVAFIMGEIGQFQHPQFPHFQIVNEALQFFGARGYSRELPLERMARDVRMFTIGGGTAEVLRNVVAGALLKKKLPQTRDGWN